MDDTERALVAAFDRAAGRLLSGGCDPAERARLLRRVGSKVVSANLRSWAIVLRANDARLTRAFGTGGEGGLHELVLSGWDVRAFCGPVVIDPPGVSLTEAARLFGVNRTTVSRWADAAPEGRAGVGTDAGCVSAGRMRVSPAGATSAPPSGKRVTWKQEVERQVAEARALAAGERLGPPASYRVRGRRLVLDYSVNRADRKRDVVRVWTPLAYGVDPGGEVAQAGWGPACRWLVGRVPGEFEQVLLRRRRRLSARSWVWEWCCSAAGGGCGGWVAKLYWPMAVWTLGARVHEGEAARCRGEVGGWGGGFVCRRCAGVVYESAEGRSSPGVRGDGSRRRVDGWDRYVKRMSGGVLTGRSVRAVARGGGGAG